MDLNVSLEFMSLRKDDPIVKDMVEALDKIRNSDYSEKALKEINLEGIINKRFKTNYTMKYTNEHSYNAAVLIPPMDQNHPFFAMMGGKPKELIDKFYAFAKKKDNIGGVHLNTCELSGIFSQIPLDLYLDRAFFTDKKVTSSGIAAVLLHEIGHTFTHYFYLINTTMANFVTVAVATEAAGASSDKERTLIFEKGQIILGLDRLAVRDLLGQGAKENASVMQGLYLKQSLDRVRSETDSGVYDLRACEQIADYFSSRFNLSADLADTLMVINLKYNQIDRRPRAVAIAFDVIVAICTMATIVLPFAFLGIITMMAVITAGYSKMEIGLYDDPKQRFTMLKNYVIKDLKDADPKDADLVKNLVRNIERINKHIDKISDYGGFLNWLSRKLSSTRRENISIIEQQKQIESLIYNETFVVAAKFKTLDN